MTDSAARDPAPEGPLDDLLDAADASRREAALPVRSGEFQIIRFRCGDRDFAVTIDAVERTERVPMVTPVPRSPSYVRGVATLRGEVVCVLDLRAYLAGEESGIGDAKSLLVVTDGERRVGVLSESLPDFQRVHTDELMDLPPTELEVYAGAIEREGELVGIIDPVRLFDHIERRLLHAR